MASRLKTSAAPHRSLTGSAFGFGTLLARPGVMESSRQRLGILSHHVQPRRGDANCPAAAADQKQSRTAGNLEGGVPIVIGGLVMDVEVRKVCSVRSFGKPVVSGRHHAAEQSKFVFANREFLARSTLVIL